MTGSADGTDDGLVERIETQLTTFLDDRSRALAELGDDLAPVAREARGFVLDGGKRLRPRFAYWGWRSVHGAEVDDSGLIPAAASLELLHACALVHDDVMDASDTRRGRPATHRSFARLHRESGWTGDADAFGEAAAILLGDLLLTWSDALFATAAIDSDRWPRARRVYDDMRQLVMSGQYLDVLVQARGEFSADEALRVIEFKTSKYTVEGPLHLGAAIAGAAPPVYAALSEFGLAVGEAFQLRDDVLGVFGDPQVTGKPAGDDLREGKQTLLTALAMSSADDGQAALLRSELGNRALDVHGVEDLREIIRTTGALDEVERRISSRAEEALTALQTDAIAADARAGLSALVATATQRRR